MELFSSPDHVVDRCPLSMWTEHSYFVGLIVILKPTLRPCGWIIGLDWIFDRLPPFILNINYGVSHIIFYASLVSDPGSSWPSFFVCLYTSHFFLASFFAGEVNLAWYSSTIVENILSLELENPIFNHAYLVTYWCTSQFCNIVCIINSISS